MTDRASMLVSEFRDTVNLLSGHYTGPGALQGTPQMTFLCALSSPLYMLMTL